MSQKPHQPPAHGHGPHGHKANQPAHESAEAMPEAAPRIPASDVPAIKGLRFSPLGADAKLINISTSGLLAECNSRLKVGSTTAVLFEGAFPEVSVVGRIARCEVSTMGKDGVLRYHVGVDFNKPITLEQFGAAGAAPAASAAAKSAPAAEPPRPRPVAVPSPGAANAAVVVRNRW